MDGQETGFLHKAEFKLKEGHHDIYNMYSSTPYPEGGVQNNISIKEQS